MIVKMGMFWKFLLIERILTLSQLRLLCHFILILNNQNGVTRFYFLAGKCLLPFMKFCTDNSYSNMFLTKTFLFVNRFSKLLLPIL